MNSIKNLVKFGGAKLLLVVAALAVMVAPALAQTTDTGGTTGAYDMTDEIGALPGGVWDVIKTNLSAVMLVAGFFIGIGLVVRLLRRFGARAKV